MENTVENVDQWTATWWRCVYTFLEISVYGISGFALNNRTFQELLFKDLSEERHAEEECR